MECWGSNSMHADKISDTWKPPLQIIFACSNVLTTSPIANISSKVKMICSCIFNTTINTNPSLDQISALIYPCPYKQKVISTEFRSNLIITSMLQILQREVSFCPLWLSTKNQPMWKWPLEMSKMLRQCTTTLPLQIAPSSKKLTCMIGGTNRDSFSRLSIN